MSAKSVDLKKRRTLTVATSVVGAIGTGFVAVPFIGSWLPSERAKAAGAPVEADFSKIEEGQQMTAKWRGKPVWILRRTTQNLKDLETETAQLLDADSEGSSQPDYCKNKYRSIKPEYLVVVGICTHLGCSPTYRKEIGATSFDANWKGGYFCACHGSKYDLAARIYSGMPAPKNMEVPPHHYIADTAIVIGVDPEGKS